MFILIIKILSLVLLIPLIVSSIYLFVFSVGGHLRRKKSQGFVQGRTSKSMAVFIPAYKEDAVIIDTAKSFLKQGYPDSYWDLYIIADSMQAATLEQLRSLKLKVIEVSFEKSTKSKALNTAIAQIDQSYDLAVILDADNQVKPDFLEAVDKAWYDGLKAAQGRRVAKNEQTPVALLDAISEEVNNHIFCQGHRNLGFSSRLIGSGMVFDYQLFAETMKGIDAVGGFDKELELKLMRDDLLIEYFPDILVFDEKVSKSETMQKQRLRWIAAQLNYLKLYIGPATIAFFKEGNHNFFDKAIQMMLVPRLMLIGISGMGLLISIFIADFSYPGLWLANMILLTTAYLLATPKRYYRTETLRAILSLPKAILLIFKAMGKIRTANQKFIHTPHGGVSNPSNTNL